MTTVEPGSYDIVLQYKTDINQLRQQLREATSTVDKHTAKLKELGNILDTVEGKERKNTQSSISYHNKKLKQAQDLINTNLKHVDVLRQQLAMYSKLASISTGVTPPKPTQSLGGMGYFASTTSYVSPAEQKARLAEQFKVEQSHLSLVKNAREQHNQAVLRDMRAFYAQEEALASKAQKDYLDKVKTRFALLDQKERERTKATQTQQWFQETYVDSPEVVKATKAIKDLDNAMAQGYITSQQYATAKKKVNDELKATFTSASLTRHELAAGTRVIDGQRVHLKGLALQWHDLKAELAQDGAGTTLGHKIGTTAQYMAAGVLIAGTAVAMQEAITTITQFDLATRTMAAVLDEPLDKTRELGKALVDLGSSYGGTLDEINKVALALGRAGTATDDLVDATEVVMKMARLTGDTLDVSSDAVISYYSVFGKGEFAYNIEQLGDKLAFVANASRLSTQDIGTFSNYALATSKSIGLTIDSLGGLAAAFSNAGLQASTIGTSIARFGTALLETNPKTVAFFDALGVNRTNFVNALRSDVQTSNQAMISFLQNLKAVNDTEFNSMIAGMEDLMARMFVTMRNNADEASRLIQESYSQSEGALRDTDVIMQSYIVSWESMWNGLRGAIIDAWSGVSEYIINDPAIRLIQQVIQSTRNVFNVVTGDQDALFKSYVDTEQARLTLQIKNAKSVQDEIKYRAELLELEELRTAETSKQVTLEGDKLSQLKQLKSILEFSGKLTKFESQALDEQIKKLEKTQPTVNVEGRASGAKPLVTNTADPLHFAQSLASAQNLSPTIVQMLNKDLDMARAKAMDFNKILKGVEGIPGLSENTLVKVQDILGNTTSTYEKQYALKSMISDVNEHDANIVTHIVDKLGEAIKIDTARQQLANNLSQQNEKLRKEREKILGLDLQIDILQSKLEGRTLSSVEIAQRELDLRAEAYLNALQRKATESEIKQLMKEMLDAQVKLNDKQEEARAKAIEQEERLQAIRGGIKTFNQSDIASAVQLNKLLAERLAIAQQNGTPESIQKAREALAQSEVDLVNLRISKEEELYNVQLKNFTVFSNNLGKSGGSISWEGIAKRRNQLAQEYYDLMLKTQPELVELEDKTALWAKAHEYAFEKTKTGWETYVENLSNVGSQMEQMMQNTFSKMEDSIMSFIETGKFSFSDFTRSILSDLARIAIRSQIIAPMAGMMGFGMATGGINVNGSVSKFANGVILGGKFVGHDSRTNDTIPAMLSPGEAVIPASVVNENRELVSALINSRVNKFATGYIANSTPMAGGTVQQTPNSGLSNVKVEIINNTSQEAKVSDVKSRFDGENYILSVVLSGIQTNKMGIRSALGGR